MLEVGLKEGLETEALHTISMIHRVGQGVNQRSDIEI